MLELPNRKRFPEQVQHGTVGPLRQNSRSFHPPPRFIPEKLEPTIRQKFSTAFKNAEHKEFSSKILVQFSTFISNETTRYLSMPKFMQSLGAETYERLIAEAKVRDVTVQSLIRTVIVPDWLKAAPTVRVGIQTPTETKPLTQPTSFLTQTGFMTQQTRRPFLNTVGRGRP